MNLFDLHCDTPFEVYKNDCNFAENSLHLSAKNASYLNKHIQVCAVWTEHSLDDDGAWVQFEKIRNRFVAEAENSGYVLVKNQESLAAADKCGRGFILAVEGARILGGREERIEKLVSSGVRVLTLQWKDSDCVGGAFNTDDGLTDFGKTVVRRAFENKIVIDLSHASGRETDECLSLACDAGFPLIASHSNSATLCPHPRNLTDGRAKKIASLGGLIGVSLVPGHLEPDGKASLDSVVRHILYFSSLGLVKNVCLGSDMDGIKTVPEGFCGVQSLSALPEMLAKGGMTDSEINGVLYGNAHDFFARYLM